MILFDLVDGGLLRVDADQSGVERLLSQDWKERLERLNATELLVQVKGQTTFIRPHEH